MEHNFVLALILTTIAGFATLIGGFCTFLVNKNNLKALSIGLAFSAGVMIFISLSELLGEAQKFLTSSFGDLAQIIAYISFFVGIIIASLIDFFLPAHFEEHIEDDTAITCSKKSNKYEIKRAGILTAIALSIHRFPEGIATFFVASTDLALGIPMAIAIAIHNFPEGIAVALPVYNATGKKRKAIFFSFLTSLAGPAGAILGYLFFKPFLSTSLIGILFAAVAGIMVYISLDTLLPLARKYGDNHHVMIGIILGMFFISMSLFLL